MRLISHPREAFRARFGFAALAEKSLDPQYYLWKGDLTGQLLIYRALQAADRGVKVRLLIDDIFHSGRDIAYAALDTHPNMEVRVYNPMGNRGAGRGANLAYHKRKLEWTAEGPDGPVVWHHELGTSAWQRFMARIMSWIPMEKEL